MVRPEGLEPPAYRFEACRSIQLSYGRLQERDYSNAGDPAQRYGRIAFRLGVMSLRLAAKHFLRAGSSIGRAADS